MGITRAALQLLAPHLTQGKTVCALGWPDLLVRPSEFQEIWPDRNIRAFGLEADFPAAKWHGLDYIPCTFDSLLAALGIKPALVIDCHRWRGKECIEDLNLPFRPVNSDWFFDLVLDHGTIEHCMNVGIALQNCAHIVNPGGLVFHGSPVTMVNHGFYNISPTLFQDFYGGNGWEILAHKMVHDGEVFILPDPVARVDPGGEVSQLFLARRPANNFKTPGWKMQTKYRKMMT